MAKQKNEKSIPLAELNPKLHVQKHIDIRLSPEQARTAKRLCAGLDKEQAFLVSGRRVTTVPDALRWLLENLENKANCHEV